MTTHEMVDSDGVRLCAEQCATCIFRPGNLMNLNPGRVREMVHGAIADGGAIVCHDTLDLSRQAICRGFWDAYRHDVQLLQLAERMAFVKHIPTRK